MLTPLAPAPQYCKILDVLHSTIMFHVGGGVRGGDQSKMLGVVSEPRAQGSGLGVKDMQGGGSTRFGT